MKKLLLLLLLFPSIAFAWSDNERALYWTSTALIVADWGQTRDIVRRKDEGYYERNQILGRYPERREVDLYFMTMLTGHHFLSNYLKEFRVPYLGTIIVTQLYTVGRNHSIGLNIRF